MADKKDTDVEKIEKLVKIMKANDLIEIEIKNDDDKILLKRQGKTPTVTAMPMMNQAMPQMVSAQPGAAAPAADAAASAEDSGLEIIKSPIVGTFYASPSPDSDPFVEIGAAVGASSVVCIIEAMKVMNEIKAECNGKIVEILVKDGQAVEFDQPLFKIKP